MKAARKVINEQDLNPLTIVEQLHQTNNGLSLGYFEDGSSIPQSYKGGRLIKSLTRNLGKVVLIKAIATSSNPYFSLIAGDVLDSPNDLARSAELFGYGSPTGIDLPGEIAGNISSDLEINRSGLYSCAIGQHSLVVTPLQTAVMLSAIANGGKILKPQMIKEKGSSASPIVKNQIFLPKEVHNILLKGMQQVVAHIYEAGLKRMSRTYYESPLAVDDFLLLKDQMIGKTSSAECMEQMNLDRDDGVQKCTHIGFGAISFEKPLSFVSHDLMGKPELIVVVYLKHGGLGTDAAPVAAQVIKKWRDIKDQKKET
jgi:cell division protein FtsI/penicillin-binding protein 2